MFSHTIKSRERIELKLSRLLHSFEYNNNKNDCDSFCRALLFKEEKNHFCEEIWVHFVCFTLLTVLMAGIIILMLIWILLIWILDTMQNEKPQIIIKIFFIALKVEMKCVFGDFILKCILSRWLTRTNK